MRQIRPSAPGDGRAAADAAADAAVGAGSATGHSLRFRPVEPYIACTAPTRCPCRGRWHRGPLADLLAALDATTAPHLLAIAVDLPSLAIDHLGLMVSGRIGFEITLKALAAEIGLVAGESAPTSLAVELMS